MTNDLEIVGVRSQEQNLYFQSDYVPLISFKNKEQKDKAEKYIILEACDFFTNILKVDIPVVQNQLASPQIITPRDFNTKKIKYFYEFLLHDLGEREANGKLKVNIKWGITFDEECTPIQVAKHDIHPQSRKIKLKYLDSRIGRPRLPYRSHIPHLQYLPYRRYGTIDINGQPIFYYIYFTLQEILDAIKQAPT
ncbi:hypothetical protein G7B40_026525 [Aetokthonos hydrillicola Thurmond2011]|jgi:hypothetical protein|uniref:Uncharacterized protein n=1 Tax=Aetokthonos hydrillicola Thurmond2011 TaxID=2712845 RepID=A0AAP5IAS6_9CYAN|nr:hypothetical protein [Aetokthonos hydrillicola]MBO3461483.1 hypothetical protein [Aetokthonos hydrillicola CCALA 1050]MBW4584878.1 hypothetical protein [Aetokthonos hydrillicola CCALA 1050]MDR9898090.1 hypothetical protein [Aetokthonos hydrillicola Thurmond2011]